MTEYSQLSRLVRRATQVARVGSRGTPRELWMLTIVGLGVERWVRHGLCTQVEASEFFEAVVAAGMELALAPQVVNVDSKGVDAKRAHAAARAERASQPGAGADRSEDDRLRRRLYAAGVAPVLVEAHVRRERAKRARAAGGAGVGDAGAVGVVGGAPSSGEGHRGG